MKTLRIWIRNVLGFSGREINGVLVLLPLMVVLIVIVPLYKAWVINRNDDFTVEARILDSLVLLWDSAVSRPEVIADRPVLSYFNPNLATESQLMSLGFTAALAKRIANYRQKGGEFRIKADLLKIYGLDSTLYTQLQAYILLPKTIAKKRHGRNVDHKPKASSLTTFDLNVADTTQLKSVPGIGPVLASRIVRFRDGLGGFIRRDQLNEVYGLDSLVIKKLWKVAFITDNFMPRKLNLNEAGAEEFSAHPYVSRNLARAIISYRFQRGGFGDVSEVRNVLGAPADDLERIIPYLTVGHN